MVIISCGFLLTLRFLRDEAKAKGREITKISHTTMPLVQQSEVRKLGILLYCRALWFLNYRYTFIIASNIIVLLAVVRTGEWM
jgi:hypothetical protein